MRDRLHIVAALGLVALAGCGADAYYVKGRVIAATDSQPIDGATVGVYLDGRLHHQRPTPITSTDGNGVFVLRFWRLFMPGDTYRYRVAKKGYSISQLTEEEMGAVRIHDLSRRERKRIMKVVKLAPLPDQEPTE